MNKSGMYNITYVAISNINSSYKEPVVPVYGKPPADNWTISRSIIHFIDQTKGLNSELIL